jgi:hypothetical protein
MAYMSIRVSLTAWFCRKVCKRYEIRGKIQKRNQLNVGLLNFDSRTQNRQSLSECMIRFTAVSGSGHWLQSRQFTAVRWLHTNQSASCFDCCVCECATNRTVGTEWRELRQHDALKGRKLCGNSFSLFQCLLEQEWRKLDVYFSVFWRFTATILLSLGWASTALKLLTFLRALCWFQLLLHAYLTALPV